VRADVLVDAGPLVALLDRSDRHHAACVGALRAMRGLIFTVWPVITEAMYLLNFSIKAQNALLEMVELGTLKIASLDERDVPRIRELMNKYKDHPMDLADAALVRIAEREKLRRVFTVDRRDFTVYRLSRLGRFSIVP
jgi:predicted nucleic acid-binding protein